MDVRSLLAPSKANPGTRLLVANSSRPPNPISSSELAPLTKYLRAAAARAELLRKILRRTGPIVAPELWPSLRMISCWADASPRLAVPAIQESLPESPIQGKGLLATEGA